MARAKEKQNARMHELPAKTNGDAAVDEAQVRKVTFAILHLERLIEAIQARMERADDDDFTKLSNALSSASRALFTGHRTLAYLAAGGASTDDALKELEALEFNED